MGSSRDRVSGALRARRKALALQTLAYRSAEKALGTAAPLLSRFVRVPPLKVSLMLTNSCNLACGSCYVLEDLNRKPQAPLSTEEWLKVIGSLGRTTAVDLVGGEVFLFRDFGRILAECGRRRLPTVVTTNGTLLGDTAVRMVSETGVHLLQISVDGLGETHDQYRGRAGLFARIEEALRLLERRRSRGLRIPYVGLKVLVMEKNLAELPALVDHFEGFPVVDKISFSLPVFNPFQNGFKVEDDLSRVLTSGGNTAEHGKEVREAFARTHAVLLGKMRDSRLSIDVRPRLRGSAGYSDFLSSPNSFGVRSCEVYKSGLTVYPDGDITPCLTYRIGNVRDHGYDLKSVLFSPRHRRFSEELGAMRGSPGCNGCIFGMHEARNR